LIDLIKVGKTTNISQFCSDWWTLTDEESYTVFKFEKEIKNCDKMKRSLSSMMVLEILSIAVINYFTSSPDVLKLTPGQI
jgi:hypothetical protein